MPSGYPRFPALQGDTIVFVAEDDLWSVAAEGGTARRLTSGRAEALHPRISPDGSTIAYTGCEEGPREVFVVPIDGGQSRRLTFDGAHQCRVTGWSRDGAAIRYSSDARTPRDQDVHLWTVDVDSGLSNRMELGRGTALVETSNGARVIAREYFKDAAHWKRYRGGTAGQLWIDADGDGHFRKMAELDGNLSYPHVIGGRVYFLSDHEGFGNVYSTDYSGQDLRRHTDHADFYARGLSGDDRRLVYHCGGSLYLLDPQADQPRRLDVHIPVTHTQRARRFVDAEQYLEAVDVNLDGSRLAVTTRGKAFSFANWEGPIAQHGTADGVRYRQVTWLHDQRRLVAVMDDGGPREAIVVMDADGTTSDRVLDLEVGRVAELVSSPSQPYIAIANHRNELLLWNVDDEGEGSVVDSSPHGAVSGITFSPDGSWISYARPGAAGTDNADENLTRDTIMLLNVTDRAPVVAAERVLGDFGPSFDPDGKYLYFIGQREFNPVYDTLHFDLNFPVGSRPYAIALRPDVPPPCLPRPKPLADSGDSGEAAPDHTIVTEGIASRVSPLPVAAAQYSLVLGASGRALVLSEPPKGELNVNGARSVPRGVLDAVDLTTGKVDRVAEGVASAAATPDGKSLLYFSEDQVRVIKATEKAPETAEYNRESGFIDLTRVKVSVRPELEWPQMLRESWRLMAENFWAEDMSGLDWDAVYERYSPLLEQIATRGELSDLMWEMHGELGTSHAYEALGDYRPAPYYSQGFLGVETATDSDGTIRLAEIMRGDVWEPEATSPLNRAGVDAAIGDAIVAVNGQPVGGAGAGLGPRLVNQAGQEVRLTLRRGDAEPHTVEVRALADESLLRYREWVEANRRAVHAASDGRVGYVHIPDMMPSGYAEFHRAYLNEYDRDCLLVDVRFNGGGHVSGLILEKLARRRIAYDYPRWSSAQAYPVEAPRGPMVALIDENAGSDGDIFSEGFRRLGLGPLVGTRTWGGVVGYYGHRPRLADGTFVSQPEVAFHFDESKWAVENYGVAPDIVVDIAPQDFAAGRDPQLVAAIAAADGELAKRPPHRSDPAPRPVKAPGALPPRPQHRGEG